MGIWNGDVLHPVMFLWYEVGLFAYPNGTSLPNKLCTSPFLSSILNRLNHCWNAELTLYSGLSSGLTFKLCNSPNLVTWINFEMKICLLFCWSHPWAHVGIFRGHFSWFDSLHIGLSTKYGTDLVYLALITSWDM